MVRVRFSWVKVRGKARVRFKISVRTSVRVRFNVSVSVSVTTYSTFDKSCISLGVRVRLVLVK